MLRGVGGLSDWIFGNQPDGNCFQKIAVQKKRQVTWCFLTRESESAWGASSTCVCGDNVKTVQKLKTPKRATGLSSADDGHFGILQQSFRPTRFILG